MALIRKIKEVNIMAVSPVSNSVIPSTTVTNKSCSIPQGVASTKTNNTTKPNPPAIVNSSYNSANTNAQKTSTSATSKPTYPSTNDTLAISNKANEAYNAAANNKEVNKKDDTDNGKVTKNESDKKGPLEIIRDRIESLFS
jgi:hypothetical protein